jgi:hypothetical protein
MIMGFFVIIIFISLYYWLNIGGESISPDQITLGGNGGKGMDMDIERNMISRIKQDVNVGYAPF